MRKIFIGIGTLIILIAGIGLFHRSFKSNLMVDKSPSAKISEVTVTQTLQLPGGDKTVNNTQPLGKTALELLQSTAQVEMKGEGVNAYVTGIDGKKADDSKKEFWAFYVNGKQAEVGAGSYTLRDGDKILWKIASY